MQIKNQSKKKSLTGCYQPVSDCFSDPLGTRIRLVDDRKTEKAFLSYIKTAPETYARMLIDQWNRSQQQK